jgi:hypothetical protein
MRERRNAYNNLVGKLEGKRTHGRPRRIWKDNIRMDLREKCRKLWFGFIWLRIEIDGGLL